MARKSIGILLVNAARSLWRTDINFREWPYGPPQHGLRYGLAWRLYHTGIRLALKGGDAFD
jgi:hypothetical protein